MSQERTSLRDLIRAAAPPFALALAAMIVCRIATGPTLGLYFGGVALAAILIPPLAASHTRPFAAFLAAAAVSDAIALIWLISSFALVQWLQAYIVLIAVGLAIFGMTLALRRIAGAALAAAITTIFFIAWLSCPIWLSPTIAARLAHVHPLLTLNHIFINFGIWTQQRLMYQLTTLGQDVPYTLPRSILACAFAHALTALSLAPFAWSSPPVESHPPRSAASPAS